MAKTFDNNVAPYLRLLTPVLMVLAMFILNSMSSNLALMASEIRSIGAEQSRRTVMVEDSYDHTRDWSMHKGDK